MTEVLFGQAFHLRFDPKQWDARQPYPPLGTLYAAALVRQAGFSVAFLDAMIAESEQEWVAALDRVRPRVAVLFEDNFNYLSKMCLGRMREAAASMIAQATARGIPVLVAGSDPSDRPEAYLDAGARAVLVGEGEQTLLDVLRSGAVDSRVDSTGLAGAEIPGLAVRGEDGRVRRTPPRPFFKDLDGLPFPAWDLVDVDRYRRTWRERHGFHSMNMVSTRGCPYHCNWCAKPIYGQRYAVRSPGNVVAELAELRERYRPDHLWFADDIFGLRPGWIEEFGALVSREDVATPFKCQLRVDLVDERVAEGLRRAGCRTVWVGAESGSQKILDAMEKGTRVEEIHRATRLLHEVGIEVGFFLQFGYPGETLADVEKTLEMVRACRPDDIGVSVSYPLPGTRFHERVGAELGAKRNWHDSNDLAMMYRGPFGTDFYRALHHCVHTEFRLRRVRERATALRGDGRVRLAERASALAWRAYYSASLPVARARLRRLARPAAAPEPGAEAP